MEMYTVVDSICRSDQDKKIELSVNQYEMESIEKPSR